MQEVLHSRKQAACEESSRDPKFHQSPPHCVALENTVSFVKQSGASGQMSRTLSAGVHGDSLRSPF